LAPCVVSARFPLPRKPFFCCFFSCPGRAIW
jgi:hypothetical protein